MRQAIVPSAVYDGTPHVVPAIVQRMLQQALALKAMLRLTDLESLVTKPFYLLQNLARSDTLAQLTGDDAVCYSGRVHNRIAYKRLRTKSPPPRR
jgi:hypothetical protein